MDEGYDSGYGQPSQLPSVPPHIRHHGYGPNVAERYSQQRSERPWIDFNDLPLTVERPKWRSEDESAAHTPPTPPSPQATSAQDDWQDHYPVPAMASRLGTPTPPTPPSPEDQPIELDPRATAAWFEPDAMEPMHSALPQPPTPPRAYPSAMDTDEHWEVPRSQSRLASHSQPPVAMDYDDDSSNIDDVVDMDSEDEAPSHVPAPSTDEDMILSTQAPDIEQVLLDPRIFRKARKELRFQPSIDIFASRTHHQLPRYFSKSADAQAAGINAMKQNWQAEAAPYINPPWSLIYQVLRKIKREQVRALVVLPEWPNADWYPLMCDMLERSMLIREPLYLDDQGHLRPAPRWNTRIAILNGSSARRI